MIEKLVERVAAWCERRGRVLDITGTGGDEDVYLRRYYVVRSPFLNVFIHRFFRSDRDHLHDHPWDFITFLVKGAYTERKWEDCLGILEGPGIAETRRAHYCCNQTIGAYFTRNRLVLRRAEDQHQVVLDRPYDHRTDDLYKAPLTVCITGPTRREWGFWKELAMTCDDGQPIRQWVPWREYLGLPPDAKGRG